MLECEPITLMGCLVCFTRMLLMTVLSFSISRAWIIMSDAWP